MARTYQKRTRRGERARDIRRPVRLPERRKGSSRRRSLASRVLCGMGVFLLCMLVAGAAFAAGGYLGLVESVQKLDEPRTYETHPTYIYSAPLGGNEDSRRVIGTIFEGQNRKTASLSEMPPHLLDAVVAKEDERFREHGGVDLLGIMRALWVDIRAGEAVEGASTITQQYVRNAYLSQDRSITRKIKEALIAIEVERKQDSSEISLQEALWKSDNTVFADLAMNAGGRGLKNGPEKITDAARRCGITTRLPEHPKPSSVLGAYEVFPLDMASAYATIAN